jgi:hypothetical protein
MKRYLLICLYNSTRCLSAAENVTQHLIVDQLSEEANVCDGNFAFCVNAHR